MRKPITIAALALSAMALGACGPEHDPHNLPWQYSLWPGASPGVQQYSTNPYAAPNAPPLYSPPVGPGTSPSR